MCIRIVHDVHVKERRCFLLRDSVRINKIQGWFPTVRFLLSITIFGEGGQGVKKQQQQQKREEIEGDP